MAIYISPNTSLINLQLKLLAYPSTYQCMIANCQNGQLQAHLKFCRNICVIEKHCMHF